MAKEIEFYSTVYISIGSNLGDRLVNIQKSINLIRDRVGVVKDISPIYETPPLDFEADTLFYNLCISVQTKLNPIEVLNETQKIELELGRSFKTVGNVYSSRIIDLDIIFFGDLIIDSPRLKIPHPLFCFRKFVLIPLSDIGNDVIDPFSIKSIHQIIAKCLDKSQLLIVEASIC